MEVAVSFISSNYDLTTTINKIEATDAEYIHVDVMDGKFVTNKNFTAEQLNDFLVTAKKDLDVHLMCVDPLKFLNDLKHLKIRRVTVHVEIDNVGEVLKNIKKMGIEVGLAVNPETDIKIIRKYQDIIDSILVMSVTPGAGGQAFKEEILQSLESIQDLRNRIKIFIDGGINDKTISLVKDKVDGVISGSFICKSENYQERINSLR